MRLLQTLLCLTLFINFSCGPTRVVSTPNEVKIMTTKQYDEKNDMVFKAVMSLLQSEQFAIESTDMDSGLIVATKNIYEKKKASLTKSVIIVDKLNDDLTEVKATVYSGNMIQDPAYYNRWFNNLSAEIARRKALMQ